MHVKTSLVQVKDQYNPSIFYVKLGKKISTNVNHAGWKLPFDQIRVLNVKMRLTLMMVRIVLAIFQINEIIIWIPCKNCKEHYLSKDFP